MVGVIAWWVSVIGALNIGITSAFDKDLLTELLGGNITRIIYIIVGVSALWLLLERFGLVKK
ncbi:MAG: DUF378 domain-containing protein [Lactobacillaceae bacterium]|jgi:uncharacterized membrane protein YuzA (DUF378 family)|nr:DUF378 domain-containing protein [Lactobacillaceae bacterium]